MGPRDFLKMCEGFNFKWRREFEMYIGNLKVMRWVGSLIYNVNVKPTNQKSPEQLMTLPELDGPQKKVRAPLITREEMEEIKKWKAPIDTI